MAKKKTDEKPADDPKPGVKVIWCGLRTPSAEELGRHVFVFPPPRPAPAPKTEEK